MIKPIFNAFKGILQWGLGSTLKGLAARIFVAAIAAASVYFGLDVSKEQQAAEQAVYAAPTTISPTVQ